MRAYIGQYWSMGTHIVGSIIASMVHHGAMLAALEWVLRCISDGWLVASVLKVNPQNVQLPSTKRKRVLNFLHKALDRENVFSKK